VFTVSLKQALVRNGLSEDPNARLPAGVGAERQSNQAFENTVRLTGGSRLKLLGDPEPTRQLGGFETRVSACSVDANAR